MPPHRQHSRPGLKDSILAQSLRAADSYRPINNARFRDDVAEDGCDHGQGDYNSYGEGGRFRGELGQGYRAADSEAGRYTGYGDTAYEGHANYSNFFEVQSQVAQCYRRYQQQAFQRGYGYGGQQCWDQAGSYQGPYPAASAQQGHQQAYHPNYQAANYYGGQRHLQPAPTYLGQTHPTWQQVYVSDAAHDFLSLAPYGYEHQGLLTQYWNTASSLDANASTFRPRVANRVPPATLNFVPGTTWQQGKQPGPELLPRQDKLPHKQFLKRPKPSQPYLKGASQALQTLEKPRSLLLVLDLNGTLLHRKARGGSSFVARPKVNEFIDYLFTNHRVMVWSSARPENVKSMCEKLFDKDQHDRLVAVWGRNTLRIPPEAYNQKVQVYKQLSWIWEDYGIQAANLESNEGWSQVNTVLIDYSKEKAASEPHNLIQIDEFQNRADQKESDVLGQVVKYLEMLKYEKDVSAFMATTPFSYQPGEEFDWRF